VTINLRLYNSSQKGTLKIRSAVSSDHELILLVSYITHKFWFHFVQM